MTGRIFAWPRHAVTASCRDLIDEVLFAEQPGYYSTAELALLRDPVH